MPSKFQKWYEKNGPDLNSRRKKKYHSDRVYRAGQLASAKNWRSGHPRKRKTRTGAAIGEVAGAVGCSIKTILNYEKFSLIPAWAGNGHRRYTLKQIALIHMLYAFRCVTHYKTDGYADKLAKISVKIFNQW